jgi:hypothetical protein
VATGTDRQRLKALHDELEAVHRRAEAELSRLCELDWDDEQEHAKAKEVYDRIYEQHQKIAWEIHVLLFPERYREESVEPDDA